MNANNPVTYVDCSGEKPCLVVDGKPFLYIGTQLSPHRLTYFGWTTDDMEQLFAAAADNGFSVLGVPVLWNWVEPEESRFVWDMVEHFIDYAVRQRIRLELLWFGSDVCSVSDPSEGCPGWALDRFEKVRAPDGQLYTAQDFNYVTYKYESFRKLDKCDRSLLAKEQHALQQLLAHVRRYIAANRYPDAVVGVQVLNEPTACRMRDNAHASVPDLVRSCSQPAQMKWSGEGYTDAVTFNIDVLWEYLNGLALAVKQSDYAVWTRVNCNKNYEGGDFIGKLVSKNEKMRVSAGTSIDFIGDDPYTENIDWIYEYGRTSIFCAGSNLPMIMENSGNYEDTDKYVFNALAGNAAYHIWELVSSGDIEGQTGFYWKNNRAKTIRPKWYRSRIRDMNRMLLKVRQPLSTRRSGGPGLVFFNRHFRQTGDSSAFVDGAEIHYVTTSGGGGIALADDVSYCFLSTADAQFAVPAALAHGPLESGYYDSGNEWQTDEEVACHVEAGRCIISVRAYECVRLLK